MVVPTFTHELLPGSPALDAGDPAFTPPPFTDQRGYARVFNGRIDIGSFEKQPTPHSHSNSYRDCHQHRQHPANANPDGDTNTAGVSPDRRV